MRLRKWAVTLSLMWGFDRRCSSELRSRGEGLRRWMREGERRWGGARACAVRMPCASVGSNSAMRRIGQAAHVPTKHRFQYRREVNVLVLRQHMNQRAAA